MDLTPTRNREEDETFIVRFSAWEGPIEAMLELARSQKIDLAQIDILELVNQFEQVVGKAMSLRIELAADWLVTAAWLTYLKSRILLRRPKDGKKPEEADGDVLAFHLKRLDGVKTAADSLSARLTLGRDWFGPGGNHGMSSVGSRLASSFHDFLSAYPKAKAEVTPEAAASLKPFDLSSVDAAINRLGAEMPGDWVKLLDLVPHASGLRLRSNIATSLIGALEMSRNGAAEIRQDEFDEPIFVRRLAGA